MVTLSMGELERLEVLTQLAERRLTQRRAFVKERLRVRHYLRYMDDFLLLAADRKEARDRLAAVRAFLSDRLRLELNPRRVVVAPIGEPCDLLGYVHHPSGRVRVRRRSVRRLWRRLPALDRRMAAGEVDAESGRASVASWFGLAKYADAYRVSKRIFMQRDVENVGKRRLVQSLASSTIRLGMVPCA